MMLGENAICERRYRRSRQNGRFRSIRSSVRTKPSDISNNSACDCKASANETAIREIHGRCRVSGYYILTGETVVEGPFETHGEASRRRAALSTSDVGVTYRIERR